MKIILVIIAVVLIAVYLVGCGKMEPSIESRVQVVETKPEVVAEVKPVEKPFVFKCGNEKKDLVPGTKVRQEDYEGKDGTGLPIGALGTVMSVYGASECKDGWSIRYDNYPSNSDDKMWCDNGKALTILSQPRCEP